MKYDVAIIGGGPVGNYLADLLAGEFNIALIEAKTSFGGKACTGIIGAESYEKLNLPREAILNEFTGAVFYSRIQSFEIKRKTPQAYIVDRKVLEKSLAERAIKKGAEYYMGTKFLGFKNGKALVQRFNERFEIEADFYVGADGVSSKVAQEIGAKTEAEFLSGYEVEVVGEFPRKDFVEVWVNKDINDEFFMWVAPVNESLARIGTFGSYDVLMRFLRLKLLNETKIIEIKAGNVGLGFRKPWVKGNVALLGDAALQIKPLTAGGIVYGMLCAHALRHAIRKNDLSIYEKLCGDIKKQIAFGLRVRRLFKALDQEKIEKLFEILSSKEAIDVIENYADFDDHRKTITALVKQPRLLAKALRITPMLLRYLV
ncbi:NAD(P)/FAD-dependent oxidoreductase [Thermococcus aggregans]|uniref:NAD(P)/FAD-dependent oxidoreductase n=1 Tax=Thermococcus aggregans TaxID=110163 RepID=A0A9E7MZH1_THEAG|nr:NAD(P)/FAD-dependent oxidoreductase [Thermococcus aggregans]USS41674.1 NAD(P)/FAD-dependent oxidoreductase [Thermococcus aggregans]